MDELKKRIKTLFEEVESIHLRKTLLISLTEAGIEKSEAHHWTLEIGQIIEEYERNLRILIDLIQESDKERIPRKLESWLAYTQDISMFKIEDIIKHIQSELVKYLPPEPEDEGEVV